MTPNALLIACGVFAVISLVLMLRGWRMRRNETIILLAVLPIFIINILVMISLPLNSDYYTQISFYLILLNILAIGVTLYRVCSYILKTDVLKTELRNDS